MEANKCCETSDNKTLYKNCTSCSNMNYGCSYLMTKQSCDKRPTDCLWKNNFCYNKTVNYAQDTDPFRCDIGATDACSLTKNLLVSNKFVDASGNPLPLVTNKKTSSDAVVPTQTSLSTCCQSIDDTTEIWNDCRQCEKVTAVCSIHNTKNDCDRKSEHCRWFDNFCYNLDNPIAKSISTETCNKYNATNVCNLYKEAGYVPSSEKSFSQATLSKTPIEESKSSPKVPIEETKPVAETIRSSPQTPDEINKWYYKLVGIIIAAIVILGLIGFALSSLIPETE
jgi:hypothetical protein